MLIKLLLLLAIGLKQATAICFHNQTSNVKRNVTGRPKAVDDYHCKIMCVENTDCLAYIFPENECFLLGEPAYDAYTTCIKQYYEWIKKIADGDCQDSIEQPNIDDEYVPNPALALAKSTNVPPIDILSPCSEGILDTILPNNSHRVQANSRSEISWDGKLGSWIFSKHLLALFNYGTVPPPTYIRAAKCVAINPTDFTDSTSCQDLPAMSIPVDRQSTYEITGPAKRNVKLIADLCPQEFMSILDYNLLDVRFTSNGYDSQVACIDGVWIEVNGQSSIKLVSGVCVKPK